MPYIEPLPLNTLDDELQQDIRRNRAANVLSSDLQVRIWAHRPKAAKRWLALLETLTVESSLPARLRELVRLKIASITNCNACQIARKSDEVTEEDIACLGSDDPRFSAAEQAALNYAELYATDYFAIGQDAFKRLEDYFTSAQIVDLNMFVAMMFTGGRMTYVQRAFPEDQKSGE